MALADWTRDHKLYAAGIVVGLLSALAGSALTGWIDRPPHTLRLLPPPVVSGAIPAATAGTSTSRTASPALEPIEDGYYPVRAGYLCRADDCSVAPAITLDSALNNPQVGDERGFFCGSIGGAPVTDRVQVQPGSIVNIRIYVDNNADPRGQHGPGIAENVNIGVLVPTINARWFNLVGFIRSDNAVPSEINDPMLVVGDQRLRLEFVKGSAKYLHLLNGRQVEDPLSDAIVSEQGVGIGNLRPGTANSGYIVLQVRVKTGS